MIRMLAIVICLGLLTSGIGVNVYPGKKEGPQEIANSRSLEKFVLDISPVLAKLEELNPEDRSDQLADWVLYGTLARTSLSSDDLRKATFNLVPVRLPFLEEVLDFDYGPGRRAFLPDGSVWLFYSARDERPQVTLARLADQVRMERGALPASLTVFRYRTELPEGAIYVEREKDIPTQKLFSPDYGYVERTVSTVEELASWLSQIDDVTHVRKISDSSIELGGRRFEKARTLGVTLEDIAALYQAHTALVGQNQEPGFSLDPQWDAEGLVQDLRLLLEDPGKLISSAREEARVARLEEQDESARRRVSSTALDVESIFQNAPKGFQLPEEARTTILGILSSIEGKSGIELEDGPILPFLQLKTDLGTAVEGTDDSIEPDQNAYLLALLEHIESRHRAQCARYDGPLQGTRVGMNLFYTDLLAKLWASVDYYREAPIDHIYGFQSNPIAGPYIEPKYWAEIWRLPSTRLWFGPNGNSYKGDPDDEEGLSFAHISTRVYAAGSNHLNPGAEATPSERGRRVYGWWDRHFTEVADYEQQYHMQNQVMKWSVIAGWLKANGILGELDEVEVDHSLRFDHWYDANKEALRFKHPLPMLPEDRWLGDTECIEILRSYDFPMAGSDSAVIEGGVSLGSDSSVNLASRYSNSVPLELRRAGLDYEKSVLGRLVNLKDSVFEFPAWSKGRALVEAIIPSKARLRMGGTELSFQTLRSEVSASSGLKEITLEADNLPMGVLRIDTAAQGNRLSFESASLLRERSLLDSFSERAAWGDMEASMLGAEDAFLPPTGHYVVELEGGQMGAIDLGGSGAGGGGPPPRIIRMAGPEGEGGKKGQIYLQTVLYSPFEGGGPGGRMEAALLTRKEALDSVNRYSWQRLRALPDREMPGELERVFVEQGPPENAAPIKVRTGDPLLQEVDGYFGDEGVLYLKRPASSDARVQQLFNDLVVDAGVRGEAVGRAWTSQQKTLDLVLSSAKGRGIQTANLLKDGRYEEALDELRAASQEGHLREAVESYQRQLSSYISEGQASPATAAFSGGPSRPGQPPSRLISALDSLHRQRPAEAVKKIGIAVTEAREGLLTGRETFREAGSEAAYDFVEARLGQVEDLSPDLAARIQLGPLGNRLHTVVDLKSLAPGRVLSRSEQERLARSIADVSPDQVYVEDSALLNKLDWDGAPGPSLSEISKSPDVAWVIVDAPEMGTFRPSFLLDGKTKLVKREIPQLSQRPSIEQMFRLKFRPQQRLYLLRSCDRDGDGMASNDERIGCLGL